MSASFMSLRLVLDSVELLEDVRAGLPGRLCRYMAMMMMMVMVAMMTAMLDDCGDRWRVVMLRLTMMLVHGGGAGGGGGGGGGGVMFSALQQRPSSCGVPKPHSGTIPDAKLKSLPEFSSWSFCASR